MKHIFWQYHPVIHLTFYIGAVLSGMLFMHPAFLACSIIFSISCYMTVAKEKRRFLSGMLLVFLLLSVLNPVFNPSGSHVLFTYMAGRHYTLEALCYGMAMAAMFVTVLTWFASYQITMTSDKFLYCFSRLLPAVSMVLTMVLRFLPLYGRHLKKIADARKGIGKSAENGTLKERTEDGMLLVSALTSWALEGGMVTSSAMLSRGYGSGSRTSFCIYKWRGKEKCLLFAMLADIVLIVYCMIKGGAFVSYLPVLEIADLSDGYRMAGLIGYATFLAIPTAAYVMEEIRWFILRYRM